MDRRFLQENRTKIQKDFLLRGKVGGKRVRGPIKGERTLRPRPRRAQQINEGEMGANEKNMYRIVLHVR